MTRPNLVLATAAVLIALLSSTAVGQIGTGFTYQGQLNDGGAPVNAPSARVIFRLWNAETGGTQIGADCVAQPVAISQGIFTTVVDFGGSAFTGEARWLEIGVDTAGGTNYTWLTPRQSVTAAPTALYAPPWLMGASGSTDIHYEAGNVGIGTDAPGYPLDVRSTSATRAIYGSSGGAAGSGVYGSSSASDGRGVSGYSGHTTGAVRGVHGWVRSPNGFGVYGANTATTGNGIGVYGEVSSSSGFAGYFAGHGYFAGRLGIGTTTPAAELDVAGTVSATGLKLTTSPQAGYVLTSDASGAGTWQAPSAGGIGGSGNPYYLPKFASASTLTSSVIYESSGGNIGIGTTVPTQKLHVLGTIRTNGLQLPVNVTAGYVLTTDATGNGTWQAPASGFTLPYIGSASSTGPALGVTNTGTGAGIQAVGNGTTTARPGLHVTNTNSGGIALFSTCTSTDANLVAVNKGTGDIIKGFSGATGGDLVFRVENNGKTSVSVLQITGGSDLSEQFDVRPSGTQIEPGTVVCIDPESPGKLLVSAEPYDRTVAGVISGAGGVRPGMMMGQRGTVADGSHPVALTGRVYVRADASMGAIQPGDLLTTSSTPGHAMRVADHERASGAILGKAMTALREGTGLVLVLVSLQ